MKTSSGIYSISLQGTTCGMTATVRDLGVWLYDNQQVVDNAGPAGVKTTHPLLLLEDKRDDDLITTVLFGLNSSS